MNKRIWLAATAIAVGFSVVGCGAGAADIPQNLPAPKTSAGPGASSKNLQDVAKSQGLASPTGNTKMSRTYNPTNPRP